MENFAVWFLLNVNLLLGLTPVPADFRSDWKISREWEYDGAGYVFQATSARIAELCSQDPNGSIEFPRVIHSAHRMTVNSHVIFQQGDFDFNKASPFYEQPVVSCLSFPPGSTVEWEVSSYSKYFARFQTTPKLVSGHSFRNFFNVDAAMISTGVLFVLSLLSLFLFSKRVSSGLLASIFIGCIGSAGYLLNCANSRFGLPLTMLESHKIADLCLWISAYFFFFGFYVEGLIPRWIAMLFGCSVVAGMTIIATGSTGSQVQLGTMIPMIPYLIIACLSAKSQFEALHGFRIGGQNVVRLFSVSAFLLSGLNDLSAIAGVTEANFSLPICYVGAFFAMSVAVNRDIDRTYQERDSLLGDLEKKVTEKTQHLSEALSSLKTTQAELIQSAKLASLGTLSAGVAHEINNSINYVSGALKPLEKRLKILIPEADQPQISKLLDAIKEGTSLTVGIVQSLRVYTGLNQAKFKEFA